MSRESHARVSRIVADAMEVAEEEREAFLESECMGSPEVLVEVRSLLSFAEDDSELSSPLQPIWIEGEPAVMPERIASYRILSRLGEGGNGVVYEAEQERPRRKVALKALHAGLRTSQRLQREASILAALDHPGIARLYELDVAETATGIQPFLTMELVRGVPLDRYVLERKLDGLEIAGLLIQICRALHHAHGRGIVHLDLKPDNILVDATGRTRILDFGISRAMEADLGISTLAFDRAQVIGTIPYMSPEQAAGRSESLGVAADVYSLGVLAYMLSGGSLPFDLKDLSPYEAVRVIQFEEPPALKGRVPGAAKDLARIAHKAIEKDPARRYGSCEQMAEDLERFVGGEPVRARPSSTWYRASRFVRRHRFLVSGSVTVIAALALALLASFEVLASQARELRFNDTRELPQLKEEARRTRLPFAEQGPWRESWLARAHKLEQRLPSSLATLDEMQSRADSRVLPDGTVELFFEDESEQWWFDNLRLYTEDMIEFTDRTNSAGHLALMEARLKLNATAYQGSIIDAHSEWDEAIQSVSDPAECPLYEGLLITPQLGLVPLGRCTSTGLWEFAHLPTGKPATFEPDLGGLLDPDSGLVLVLIPSAEFLMGAQSHSADYPNYDPSCEDWEKCLLFTQLDPFFISKYEMTGEQWLAIRGAHQPFYTPPYTSYGDSDADCHPVESLSWNQALLECLGMGLDLPSEARWEWAARGGTTTPWFSGADPESLLGFANLGDNFLSQSRSSQWGREDWLNDGHVIHSRVGSYLPNGYGLHDIHGNVGELTKDSRPNYQSVDRSSSGDGLWHEKRFRTVVRGGSFSLGAKDCRITARRAIDHSVRSDDIGLRPCRDIDGYSTYSRGGVPQQENTPAALVRYLASRE